MAELTVAEITAEQTHPLRLAVLRHDTPTEVVDFREDHVEGTIHLAVRDRGAIVAVSTWAPRPCPADPGVPGVQLRGMATARHRQGSGIGGLLVESGVRRAFDDGAEVVWARARDAALAFYVRHGFEVVGDGFVDEATQLPHHLIVRRRPV
jgi:GNAT superfamily N-acetyltransferase